MGRFDNYDNRYGIKLAQQNLYKLQHSYRPDPYALELAGKELQKQWRFRHCQIFTQLSRNSNDPNEEFMFSDDNKEMLFKGNLIRYQDLSYYEVEKNIETLTTVGRTKTKGGFTRAIIGGAIAGPVGAIVGASTARKVTETKDQTVNRGFILTLVLYTGQSYSFNVPKAGLFTDDMSLKWKELLTKLDMIVTVNRNFYGRK